MNAGTKDGKPCRITIVGTARTISAMPDMLRVKTEWGSTLLINTACLDTAVEWLDPITEWSDGDVVAGKVTVWTRRGGKWHSVNDFGVATACDGDMTQAVQLDPDTVVLRRQVAA